MLRARQSPSASFGVGSCETGTRIALRPHFASRLAVSRLLDIVLQQNPARVALAHDARLASWKLIIGADRAIARIEELVAEAQNSLPRPLIATGRLALERCVDIADGQLLPVLQAWHQRQGRWEADLFGRLLDWKLLPHTTITEQPKSSERLLVRHWGARILTYGKDWPRIARGRDLEDQPNAEFGWWRAAMLRKKIAERVPRLSASDAVFRGIDGKLVRSTNSRLVLPWRRSDGSALVTTITVGRRIIVLERPNPAN
jgi:hypothetical protein